MVQVAAKVEALNDGAVRVTWANIKNGDTVEPAKVPARPDKTAHIFGTPNGATTKLQGSSDPLVQSNPGSANFVNLKSLDGVEISITDFTTQANMPVILEAPEWIKPLITGAGASTDITIVLICP